jgi:hypothetical protein
MPIPFRSNLDFGGIVKVINAVDATAAQEYVTKAQLDAAIEGLKTKNPARVRTTSNINIASPGASLDGVAFAAGDNNKRVVLDGQTNAAENGVYDWNGAAVAMTRSTDASTLAELANAVIDILEGSSANSTFRQTTVTGTLGTDPIDFVSFGSASPAASTTVAGIIEIATQGEVDAGVAANLAVTPQTLAGYAGRLRKVSQTFGDGSATQYDITHGLNTLDVQVSVFKNSTGVDHGVQVTRTNVNTVRLNFDGTAPTSDEFRVVIIG